MIGNLSGGIHLPSCNSGDINLKCKTKRSLDNGTAKRQGRTKSN